MPAPSTLLRQLLSWRVAAILLFIINLKSVPFAWHIRILYQGYKYFYSLPRVQKTLQGALATGKIHPIFDSVSIYTHTSVYETDYNIHKSNSTYFSDLDESRAALMTKLYVPGIRPGSAELEEQGYKGRYKVILGSVHTSFHKEIAPYERYEVHSRVLGWDKKWVVIGSFFIRPAKNGKEETLLASCLSKYVAKKGRFTIAPERCLRSAGWLPDRPSDVESDSPQSAEERSSSSDISTLRDADKDKQSPQTEEIATAAPEGALHIAEVVGKLEEVASHVTGESSTFDVSIATPPRAVEWDWHRIEKERLRGLQLAQNWLGLDTALPAEYAHREN